MLLNIINIMINQSHFYDFWAVFSMFDIFMVFFLIFSKNFCEIKRRNYGLFFGKNLGFFNAKKNFFLFSFNFSVRILNWFSIFFTTKAKFVQKYNVNLTPVKFWRKVYLIKNFVGFPIILSTPDFKILLLTLLHSPIYSDDHLVPVCSFCFTFSFSYSGFWLLASGSLHQ